MNFTGLLGALNQASGFQLFRLHAAIDRLLDQPHWVERVRERLSIGQNIEYFDPQSNRLQSGHIIEFRRKRLLIQPPHTAERYLIPYVAINVEGLDTRIQETPSKVFGANELSVGDLVGFRDHSYRERTGQITRLNDKTVTLVSDRQRWRVAYSLLHRVVEGNAHH